MVPGCTLVCMLGSLFHMLYIDDGINGFVDKLANYMKMGGGAGCVEELGNLKKDLNQLGKWAKKWQMD